MSQHDGTVDDASGAIVRADINSALQAILSNNSGTSAPSTTYANMWWLDTTNHVLKQRNEANSAWIIRGSSDAEGLVTKSSGFTAGVRDFGKAFDISTALTMELDAAATLTDGWWCDVINRSSGSVVIDPDGAELINGGATLTLYAGESCRVWCNGSAFRAACLPPVMTGDSGSGGLRGLVPAPASGDAAASKYLKADGTWTAVTVTTPGLTLLDSETISSAATVVLTGLSNTYEAFLVIGDNLTPATDGTRLLFEVSTDGGSTWHSATNWAGVGYLHSTLATFSPIEGSGVFRFLPGGSNALQLGNDADNGISFTMMCNGFSSTSKRKHIRGDMNWVGSEATGTDYGGTFSAGLVLADDITALRFKMASGNIASGWIGVYGVRKS